MKTIIFFITVLISMNLYSQEFDYFPTSTTGQIIKHTYYTLSYSEQNEQAEWVAYELTKSRVYGEVSRTDNFREDPLVKTGSATLNDYKGSGYDRGHLAPAGDMKFSGTAMSESFYMSNMSPQTPGFNRGIWKKLEAQVRTWAVENEHIYIVTGGIFSSKIGSIGNGVTIPKYYYKVILDYKEPGIKAIALILPNEKGTKQLDEYVISIDRVENLTGIDFFPALPDDLENKLEADSDPSKWSFSSITISTSSKSQSVQCKGITQAGTRCKRMTTNENGYCWQHQDQVKGTKTVKPTPAKRTIAVQCKGITQSGTRCKRKTTNLNGYGWQHQDQAKKK